MKTGLILIAIFIISILIFSCKTESPEQKGSSVYIAEIDQWHQERIERLKAENSWLTLVGLHWLKEGENTFGSDKMNNIIFPGNAPGNIGTIILRDSLITLKVEEGVNVLNDGNPVREIKLEDDLSGNPTVLDIGSLRWYIINRDGRYGIRLRDTEYPLRKEFTEIERFPVNEDWKITAAFDSYDPPKIISLPTQLGTIVEESSPGAVVFNKYGKEYRIDVLDTGRRLWLIFADETSGEETYGAGRYLYIDKPDSTGETIVDFNLAYNPPCVFTKYATCSFPPKQNILKLRIAAGEKMWNMY